MRSASISSCGGAGPGASHDGAAPRAHEPRLSDSRRGVLSPGRPRRWRLPGGDDQADRRTPARARPRPPRRWSHGFGRQRPSTPTVVSGWNPCPPFDFERRDCRSGRGQTRRPPRTAGTGRPAATPPRPSDSTGSAKDRGASGSVGAVQAKTADQRAASGSGPPPGQSSRVPAHPLSPAHRISTGSLTSSLGAAISRLALLLSRPGSQIVSVFLLYGNAKPSDLSA